MSLSCDCGDEWAWWHDSGSEVAPLATRRARKCCSCKERIAIGDDCKAFARWRSPDYGSVAERIYGDEEPLPTWYLCDRCAGLYEALDSLGFCFQLDDDMRTLCREYAQMQRDAGIFTGNVEKRT